MTRIKTNKGESPMDMKQLLTIWLFNLVNPTLAATILDPKQTDLDAVASRMGMQSGDQLKLAMGNAGIHGGPTLGAAARTFAGFATSSGYPGGSGPVCGRVSEVLDALYPAPAPANSTE
jgi:hypothetical protein